MEENPLKKIKYDNKIKITDEVTGKETSQIEILNLVNDYEIELHKLDDESNAMQLRISYQYLDAASIIRKKRNELLKNIPNFWLTVLSQHPVLPLHMNVSEDKCLKYINDIEILPLRKWEMGYIINFHFNECPFFRNKILTKEFSIRGSVHGPIEWKDKSEELNDMIPKQGQKFSFLSWYLQNSDVNDNVAEMIKDDICTWPMQYYVMDQIGDSDSDLESNDDDSEINEAKISGDMDSDTSTDFGTIHS